ncbi:MAG: FAD binding domain-containing protein [Anaerolineae bacterium]|nr:FAD binding domain-containing protein [Anaerolineae bacterium]
MKLWSRYHVPRTVEQAIELLTEYAGHAQIIAGGTDLLIDVQAGNHPPIEALIDITRINEIKQIQIIEDGADRYAEIGGAVTHSAIVARPEIRSYATSLVESCGVVGGPQVRNVATIGGNVVHALPAADGTLSLVALDASAEVATPDGRKTYPITELFAGPGKSIVESNRHLLTKFRFRLSNFGEGSAFQRMMRPQGVALPILGCAVWIRLDEARERFAAVNISIGPVTPTPQRAKQIEDSLIGELANSDSINRAAQLAKQTLKPRTSKYRATAEYRVEMVELLLRGSLETALVRARTGEAIPEGVDQL